jgi:hypothetical protein
MKKFLLALAFAACIGAGTYFVANDQPTEAFVCVYAVPAALTFSPRLGIKGIVYDTHLTNFAHGIAPDFSSALAELMAPQCVAPAAFGQYIAFDDDDAFRYIETRRALGGDMALIDLPSSAPRFNCDPHALGIPTDNFEIERVGDAGTPMLREAKVRTLISRNALSREKRVFNAYEAGTTPEAGLGTWTDATKDPIVELDGMVSDLATATGNADIHMVWGLPALRQFRAHPTVRKYFPGAEMIAITPEKISQLLILPVKIHIGMLPIVMEKVGKAANKVNIVGSKIYAFITQANPSPFDPSAAKTFTTRLGQVEGVGLVERPPFAEINYLAWSEDIKMTGAKCVKRVDVATGAIA